MTGALLATALGIAAASCAPRWCARLFCKRQIGPVDVYGFVELVEPRASKGQRLTIRVTALEKHEPHEWPYRVRVRTMTETAALEPGDAVRLKATLSPPPGPALPGDYDFARAAWFQGLGAVGYATAAPELAASAVEPPLGLRVTAAVARLRQAIGRRVVEALPGQTGAIANALITGERGGISEATNQAFRDSGLFHILSISGLHMVIMAGAVFFSIRLLAGRRPGDRAALPDQEMGGGGRDGRRLRLSDDLGRRLRHRALLHHDLHHVPGGDARSAGGGAAQRGAGRAGDPAGVAGEPVRSGLPDVVCRGRGAGRRPTSGCASARRSAPR